MNPQSTILSPTAPLSGKERRISRIEHARLLNPLRKHLEEKAAAASAVGKNEDLNPVDSLRLILIEGDFTVTAQERLALDELRKDLSDFDAKMLYHGRDAVRARYQADILTGPQPELEDLVESGRKHASTIKRSKWERIKQFAPTARAIVQRALEIVEGTEGVLFEREKDTALAFGYAFHPSHTLKAIGNAAGPLRETLRLSSREPDLIDVGLIERLTDGFGSAE